MALLLLSANSFVLGFVKENKCKEKSNFNKNKPLDLHLCDVKSWYSIFHCAMEKK